MATLQLSQPARCDRNEANKQVSAALSERREEIERAALTRVYAIADPIEAADPEYADGLRLAVAAALDYGLAAVEQGEERAPPVPATLLAQARLAARAGVNLDTVLRRYFAGYTMFGDFLVGEASGRLGGSGLQHLLQGQAALFDRLVAAVTEEYERESSNRRQSSEQRRLNRVQRMLHGELLDVSSLAYDMDAWHIGIVATAPNASVALRTLAESIDRTLLLVRPDEETAWGWLGGRRPIPTNKIIDRFSANRSETHIVAAWGEPAYGVAGWRLTHRQAMAGMRIARRGENPMVRYANVALLATILQDDVLVASLRQLYLDPLSKAPDGGAVLRETIRAYLNTGGNISSTAVMLKVNRRTIARRLRMVEDLLGRTIDACAPEIEAALRVWEIHSHKLDPSAQYVTHD